MRIKNRYFLASSMLVLLAACASPTIAPESNALTAEALLRAEPLTGAADVPELNDVDVLVLDEEMVAFLDEYVNRRQPGKRKTQELLYAIQTEISSGLEFEDKTLTAQETYQSRLGNCLSFTNMFVAMAREVGLEVSYQEVEIAPNWSLEGDTYVLNRHVNAVVDLGSGTTREVDFNVGDFQGGIHEKLISDDRALAHYYSNVGVEHLQKDELVEALRYFRKALASDDRFAPAWSNVGVLYSKAGYLDYAEAAYVQALMLNPEELVAMSNLGQLYERQGQAELAEWYKERSNRHRMRNPYYRYHLAQRAFLAKDYDSAIEHLEYSVRKQRDESTFHSLMGLSYLQAGNESSARRSLERAEQLAEDDGLKRKYQGKLELLFSQED